MVIMRSREFMRKQRSGIGYVLAGALFLSTCGVSSIRGGVGMSKMGDATHLLAKKIDRHKISPDCLKDNKKIARAITPILGKKDAGKVAERIAIDVGEYEKGIQEASTEKEREKASLRLAAVVRRAIMINAIEKSSTLEKIDYWYTAMTMVALPDASDHGGRDVVYGPKVMECMDAINDVCVCSK